MWKTLFVLGCLESLRKRYEGPIAEILDIGNTPVGFLLKKSFVLGMFGISIYVGGTYEEPIVENPNPRHWENSGRLLLEKLHSFLDVWILHVGKQIRWNDG